MEKLQFKHTQKNLRDFLNILSLFKTDINAPQLLIIIKKYKLESELKVFMEILNERNEALELNLNCHKYKKLKNDIILSIKI